MLKQNEYNLLSGRLETVRCLWFLWCEDLACDWLQHNKHSRHILGVHGNIISAVIAFDKGERLHSAVAFENFGLFIDTDLAPPKNSSGAKLFRENDVIFIGHVLNLVLRLSLLCLLNEVAMCFVSTRSPGVLPCSVWPSLRVWCAFLSNSGLCFLVYFICSRSQSPRLRDVNLGNSRIWLHLLI